MSTKQFTLLKLLLHVAIIDGGHEHTLVGYFE